jgi:hypothetical protein
MPPVAERHRAQGLPYKRRRCSTIVRSNTVVVVGRTDAVMLAGGLIAELDRPSGEFGGKRAW